MRADAAGMSACATDQVLRLAGTLVLHGCALWTRNRKHYPMPDIELF